MQRGEPRQPPPQTAPTPFSPRWRPRPPPIETPCTTPKPAPSKHADATPPPQHRLDTAPRRHRRTLRHDLHIAEHQLDRAEDYLERTRQRTAPAVERHTQAVADQRDAHEQLRTCDTIDRLDAMLPSVGEHRLHVQALTTWKHWAEGHDVPDDALHTRVRRPRSPTGPRTTARRRPPPRPRQHAPSTASRSRRPTSSLTADASRTTRSRHRAVTPDAATRTGPAPRCCRAVPPTEHGRPATVGLSCFRCNWVGRVQLLVVVKRRSPKVMAKALRAGFQRFIQRRRPQPGGIQ